MERFHNTKLYEPFLLRGNDSRWGPARTTDISMCKTKLDFYFWLTVLFQFRVKEVLTVETPLSSPEAGCDQSLFNSVRRGDWDAAGRETLSLSSCKLPALHSLSGLCRFLNQAVGTQWEGLLHEAPAPTEFLQAKQCVAWKCWYFLLIIKRVE